MRSILLSAALAVVTATGAMAQNVPWEQPAPAMNGTQNQAAAAVNRIVQTSNNPLRRLGFNPLTTEWDWQGGRRAEEPMSNMTFSGLRNLVSGKYRVYQSGGAASNGLINVDYYHENGTVYRCINDLDSWEGDTAQWYAGQSAMGFSGLLKLTIPASQREAKRNSTYGWPTVYNPSTGQLVGYGYYDDPQGGRSWQANPGHIQAEYAPVFAELCPNLPRVNRVNQNQTARDYATFLSQGRGAPVRGAGGTVFTVDPNNPLTAEMYYASYPPQQ